MLGTELRKGSKRTRQVGRPSADRPNERTCVRDQRRLVGLRRNGDHDTRAAGRPALQLERCADVRCALAYAGQAEAIRYRPRVKAPTIVYDVDADLVALKDHL